MKKTVFSLVMTILLFACTMLPALAEGMQVIIWQTSQDDTASDDAEVPEYQASRNLSSVSVVKLKGEMTYDEVNNCLGYKAEGSDDYVLIDADGNQLMSETFRSLRSDYSHPGFVVSVANVDPVESYGMVDSEGHWLVPPQYAHIVIVSDRWVVGEKAMACGSNEPVDFFSVDPATGVRQGYAVSSADIYYRGSLAGRLNGASYKPDNIRSFGDYIAVMNKQGQYIYYDKTLTPSSYRDTSSYASEFHSSYEDGGLKYIHCGTNTVAFAPGCTLTPDEVVDAFTYNYNDEAILDLQGRTVYKAKSSGYITDRYGDYFVFEDGDRYGVLDVNGNVVISPQYDSIGNYTHIPLFHDGYVSATSGGYSGFLDAQGNVSVPLRYPANYEHTSSWSNTFTVMQNLDNTYTVISAAVGELPESFIDIWHNSYDPAVICGEIKEDVWVLKNLRGETLLEVPNTWWMTASHDGKWALTREKKTEEKPGTIDYLLFHLQF